MNWIDGVIIVAIVLYIIDGYRRGFVELIIDLSGFFVATFLALKYDGWMGQLLGEQLKLPVSMQRSAGFIAIWFFVQILFSVGIHFIYRFLPNKLNKSKLNKLAGILPSLAKGLVLISLLLMLILALPIQPKLKAAVSESALGNNMVKKTAYFEGAFNRIFGPVINDTITFLTVKPPSNKILRENESLDLGFKTTDVKIDEASESRMMVLVNQERAKVGLKALVYDPEIQVVARKHAADMFAKGYFSHVNLEGQDPFDRLRAAGVQFTAAGENLALAPNVDLAHNGLMNSEGHRANILEPEFGRLGVGVIDGGIYGKIFVQNFRN